MIELVLVYCMMGTAEGCVERRQELEPPAGVMECMIAAQQVATRYLETHPKHYLRAWRCEKDKPREQPA